MTIFELKAKLSLYPDNYQVVLDTSRDYEDYDYASSVTPCEIGGSPCGMVVEKVDRWNPNVNAVIIT